MSTNEVETRARALGWSPKEQFRGKAEHWVDAETYVKRGEEVMPILKENNKRLENDLADTRTQLAKAQKLIEESQAAIKELGKFNSEVMRERAEQKKADLVAGLKQAKKDGDVDAEVDLTTQLAEHTQAIAEADKKPVVETKAETPPADQTTATAKAEWTQWTADNPWYTSDPIKRNLANGIAEKLRLDKSPLIGRAFFDEVAKQVDAYSGGNSRREAPDKLEGGGRGSGVGGGGGGGEPAAKSWADLDADAKAACDRFNKTLVGPGKSYKTVEDWRKAYAADYFSRA